MRAPTAQQVGVLTLLAGFSLLTLLGQPPVHAGGPLAVGGNFGVDGVPFVWDTSTPIPYRTDGPTNPAAAALGMLTKAQADARVAAMFQIWQDVPTANISFTHAGNLNSVTGFTDGNVNSVDEYDAVIGSCGDERTDATKQSPIIYDANGSLFTELGLPDNVIGFAGPCQLSTNSVDTNRISGGSAAMNGKFQDGNLVNGEISDPDKYDEVFIHEFGHMIGLDHSQINVNVLEGIPRSQDDLFGLPLMFPVLLSSEPARVDQGFPHLAPDDEAWISFLYPDSSFATSFGKIHGEIRFSDGVTPLQGGNVIARVLDDPATTEVNESRRQAVSVVSGYLFTGNPGQPVTGTNTDGSSFGSRDPALVGFYEIPLKPDTYRLAVECIREEFTGGSSVGPLGDAAGEQICPSGRSPVFDPVAVAAGGELESHVILEFTSPRFDAFEGPGLRNDSIATAVPLSGGGTFLVSISPLSDPSTTGPDQDFYRLSAAPGTTVGVEIVSRRKGRKLDSVVEMLRANGSRFTTCRESGDDPDSTTGSLSGLDGSSDPTPEAFDDTCINDDIDLGEIRDSRVEFQVPMGEGNPVEFFIHVFDWRGDARPDFDYDLVITGLPEATFRLFGVTECCPNQFVVINTDTGALTVLSDLGTSTEGLAVGASAVDRYGHRLFLALRAPSRIMTIDTLTGAASSSPTLGAELISLGYHLGNGTLFGLTQCCPNQFVSINPGTGAMSVLGTVGTSADPLVPGAAALDSHNSRYFLALQSPMRLLTIDTQTAGITIVPGFLEVLAMDYHWGRGSLVGVSRCCPNKAISILPSNAATGYGICDLGTSTDRFGTGTVAAYVGGNPSINSALFFVPLRSPPRILSVDTGVGCGVASPALSREVIVLGVE